MVDDIADIEHPVVRTVLQMMNVTEGVEIHHDGDLPSRAGLGSSSSFTVGMLNAINALQGKMVSKEELARDAIHVEQNLLKENVGVQDQIAVAYGGLNRIDIFPDDSFSVRALHISARRRAELEDRMLLFYTGVSRSASEIAGQKISAIPQKTATMERIRAMVDEAVDILRGDGDINDFGRLLDEAWRQKRSLSKAIAPKFIDDIYDRATKAGATGGKLLGAGGGGFMLFFVDPQHVESVLKALDDLLVVPIEMERHGSQIIFFEPDKYTRRSLRERDFVR